MEEDNENKLLLLDELLGAAAEDSMDVDEDNTLINEFMVDFPGINQNTLPNIDTDPAGATPAPANP